MPNKRKRNRSGQLGPAHRRHEDYLIRSLGTPDGLRALGELVRNAAAGLTMFVITTFALFGTHSFTRTLLRLAGALVLNKALVGFELLAKSTKLRRFR